MEELEYEYISRPSAPKKGQIWPALLSMGVMLVIGIVVFALTYTPAPGTQRDPNMPWFVVSDGTLYFDAEYYTGGEELAVPVTVAGQKITALGEGCFAGTDKLVTVYLPSSITTIAEAAFYGCTSLRGIMLPEGLLSMGSDVFSDCYALEAICIPAGLQEVGVDAFYACDALRFVFYGGTREQWKALGLKDFPGNTTIYTSEDSYPNG